MARTDALLRLHQTLTARRAELRKRLGIELDDMSRGKNLSTSGDAADAAFSHSGEEMASQLAELEARELRQVERALVRLKQGTYGRCEGCAAHIPVARLNALPFSTLCIKCQREAEHDTMWFEDRGLTDWASVSDAGSDDREVNLSQLESDFAK